MSSTGRAAKIFSHTDRFGHTLNSAENSDADGDDESAEGAPRPPNVIEEPPTMIRRLTRTLSEKAASLVSLSPNLPGRRLSAGFTGETPPPEARVDDDDVGACGCVAPVSLKSFKVLDRCRGTAQ